MRAQAARTSGQRPLDSRSLNQPACSCSYSVPSIKKLGRQTAGTSRSQPEPVWGRRPQFGAGAPAACGAIKLNARRYRDLHCTAAASSEPGAEISGYTPANYISFSDNPDNIASHSFSIVVDAPASVCFNIWNDWNRLVEFLDLVAQIGLDPNNPDLALFQCFYRHGMLPVMEIVFVLQKTSVEQDSSIAFESVWGMPLSGVVAFEERADGRTEVQLDFEQALPDMLVDLKVGAWGLQSSLMPIFRENLEAFASLAEAQARDPSSVPPRQEAEAERLYPVFDEEADIREFMEIMDSLDLSELGEGEEEVDADAALEDESEGGAAERQQPGASGTGTSNGGALGAVAAAMGATAAAAAAAQTGKRSAAQGSSSSGLGTSGREGQEGRLGGSAGVDRSGGGAASRSSSSSSSSGQVGSASGRSGPTGDADLTSTGLGRSRTKGTGAGAMGRTSVEEAVGRQPARSGSGASSAPSSAREDAKPKDSGAKGMAAGKKRAGGPR